MACIDMSKNPSCRMMSLTELSSNITSYPQVNVRPVAGHEGGNNRGLFASKPFEPGQLIFQERPILHTSHPVSQSFTPTPELEIPYDWQRILYLYAHFRVHNLQSVVLEGILIDLSLDGVCSELAKETDPDRELEYHQWAEDWIQWYSEQNDLSESQWKPTSEEIFRLIVILETNSHSRDEDDMRDLQDPRLGTNDDTQSGIPQDMDVDMIPSASANEDGDDEIKDEACGLWIMASMLNHSCLPNCTVYIPPTKRTGQEAILYLRCIRPVSAGEELLVSYHDEEFLPTLDRRAILLSRGFECRCLLCTGQVREYMRSAVCFNPACADGQGACCPVMVSGETRWVCDRCGGAMNEEACSAVEQKEKEWLGEWEQILAMMSGDIPAEQCGHLMAYQVIQHLAQPGLLSIPEGGRPLTPPCLPFISPMHVTHSHLYTLLKYILFEHSFWLRQHFGYGGVHGVLLTMLAIVERSLGSLEDDGLSLNVSDERRVLGYWIVKEAERQLNQDSVQNDGNLRIWQIMRDEGLQRWEIGMQYLCSRN